MRLFVAVRPPAEVVDVIGALPRPERHGIRWTRSDQWHVTLRFLGDVEDHEPVAAALCAGLAGAPQATVTVGPATAKLGRGVLMIPVQGLDELAATVLDATSAVVPEPEGAFSFRGHLTLARCPRSVPRWAIGTLVGATWTADQVELVSSRLGGGPPVHDVIARFGLG